MNFKNLFINAGNSLEDSENGENKKITETVYTCPKCQEKISKRRLREAFPCCRYYFRLSARLRLRLIVDRDSFLEFDRDFSSENLLDFPDYDEKLDKAKKKSGEKEAVITGKATIGGYLCCVFAMDSEFMMGSMGTVVGDKLTRLFEYATKQSLPVIGFTASGGARMQEGMLSLIQMAKVSGAVKRHSDSGNLYVTVLTNPTTGGVTASFAMLGDIILAEPKALIGFAGPRVIEQTTKKKLPEGFQKAEYLLNCGFVDDIVTRDCMKEYLEKLLMFHNAEKDVNVDE
jgi:acetyl-CoA carboxylase carboxyl transferase subunit beta